MSTRALRLAATALVVAIGVGACGSKGDDGGGSADQGGVKTGPGVTADAIKLGAMTDLTGVFAALGKNVTQGNQIYFDELNAAGGVCNRKIQLQVQDHGYDPQRAVTLYRQSAPEVAGFTQMLGAPITTALAPTITRDKVLTSVTSWPSNLLGEDYMFITGSTYDIETINAIDFLMTDQGLKSGDAIGHIYFEGELGENALLGSKYSAQQNNLRLVEQRIKPTDTDLSPQISALRRAGVKAIIVSGAPRQLASATAVSRSVGLDVPVITNAPGYAPQLLATPAGDALTANAYNATSFAPFSADKPDVTQLAKAYEQKYPNETPTALVTYGYGAAEIFGNILKKACENKDLSRDGLRNALRQLTNVDTGGVIVTSDYSKPGEPPSRATYISKPVRGTPGGLRIVKEAFVSKTAEGYQPPAGSE